MIKNTKNKNYIKKFSFTIIYTNRQYAITWTSTDKDIQITSTLFRTTWGLPDNRQFVYKTFPTILGPIQLSWCFHYMETLSALLAYWEFTSQRWISRTKASDADDCFESAYEPTVEQTMETPVIEYAIELIMTSL